MESFSAGLKVHFGLPMFPTIILEPFTVSLMTCN